MPAHDKPAIWLSECTSLGSAVSIYYARGKALWNSTVTGIVESADQKQRAEQLAMQVKGVKRVQNNLQVQGKK